MYTLYFSPGTCALATHTVLNELGLEVNAVDRAGVQNYDAVNLVGAVPTLVDGDLVVTEGAAILLHILSTNKNTLLPEDGTERTLAIRDMMFANATMHPAYGRLFFLADALNEGDSQSIAFDAAAVAINRLWQVVEDRLQVKPFFGGDTPACADFLLAVYSTWGEYFPVDIKIGCKAREMIDAVLSRPSFRLAQEVQQLNTVA